MSNVDNILLHLDRVKQTRPDSWMACCPSHGDRSASLSIRELDDGRILVHCFAGCTVHDVLAAVGMDISDLFPPREIQQGKREHRPFPAVDCLRAVAFEALVVASAGASLLAGEPFSAVDRERLIQAVARIQSALTAAGVRYA